MRLQALMVPDTWMKNVYRLVKTLATGILSGFAPDRATDGFHDAKPSLRTEVIPIIHPGRKPTAELAPGMPLTMRA
ncbi:MAG: hypothetical protein HY774_10245 [Acidobacteria bacterium]|nr:hypothetical protein [Acidobacteriota bacterium]